MQNKKIMKAINCTQLEIARKSRLLTQTQLANKLEIDSRKYSKIELGEHRIEQSLLDKIVDILDYPLDFFLEEGNNIALPISLHESGNFRKRQDISKKVLFSVESTIGIYLGCLKKLKSKLDLQFNKSIYPVNAEEFNNDIENIAEQLRLQWSIPSGPIKNLTTVIENAGCVIIKYDFGTEKIDGFSIWIQDIFPVIFIRHGLSGDRERFTLAHELGHLFLHTKRLSPNKEKEANDFASAFLMPYSDIKKDLNNLNIYKLQNLKEKWKVSMAAIAYRAKELDFISDSQYRYIFMELSRCGYRKKEPIYIAPEVPLSLKEMKDAFIYELEYSIDELKKFLCLNESDFNKLFLFNEKNNKVVYL